MNQEKINEARKRIYELIQEFYTLQNRRQTLITTKENADIILTILYQRSQEEPNPLTTEEKELLNFFEEQRKNEPLINERINQIQDPTSKDGKIVEMARTLSRQFGRPTEQDKEIINMINIASQKIKKSSETNDIAEREEAEKIIEQLHRPPLRFSFKPSLNDSNFLDQNFDQFAKMMLNWKNWQQNQSTFGRKSILPRSNNNPFPQNNIQQAQKGQMTQTECTCETCKTRRTGKELILLKANEVGKHIKEMEKQIYEIFKEYEKIDTQFNAEINYKLIDIARISTTTPREPLKEFQKFFNQKRKENIQLDNFLKQQEELQYLEENSEDSEESEYHSTTENFGRYPMTHTITNEEHHLLRNNNTFFSTKQVTFFDQEAHRKPTAQKYFGQIEKSSEEESDDLDLYSTPQYIIPKIQKPSTMMRNPKLIKITLKKETEEELDKIIREWEYDYPMDYFIRTDQNLIDLIFEENTLKENSPLFELKKRFLRAKILNFDIFNYFKDLEEMRKTVKLIVIDNEGEELKINEPEKRIIKQLSKLPLSKLLDLQDIIKTHATLVAGGGAIAVGKTTWFRRLKLYLMNLGCQVFLPQEITLEHKPLLELMYSDIEKYSFMFQQFVIQQFEINYRKIKQLETEGKIGPNSLILFDRSKNDFWPFMWTNIKNPKELEELTRFYNATSTSFDMIPTDIREPDHMIRSLFIHEAERLKIKRIRIEEMTITNEMRNYINNLPITGYTLITPFKLSNSEYQVLAARRSMTTKVYAQQYSYFGKKREMTDKTYRDCVKREALEELKLKTEGHKLQLYMIHEYLSKNKSGTDPVLQTDNLEDAKFLVQVPMYLYLMTTFDQTRWKYNEPNNMEKPKWMTYEECTHEI
ncbi:hypothetical protein F8M41_018545 [Gigaspora margarita]|uniref:Nudix hydrolase domain-containing protein n=1 Tax=Gigaspora margarita TaxID=4874 RepID=A0A8H4ALC7_GIGMA|nr:hypothetical protein F8M41_018545 [Gigaspora margarita]